MNERIEVDLSAQEQAELIRTYVRATMSEPSIEIFEEAMNELDELVPTMPIIEAVSIAASNAMLNEACITALTELVETKTQEIDEDDE